MNKIIELAKALRLVEILGKLGFVLVGALFAISGWSWEVVLVLAKISIYSFVCALAIFCFNSYSGYESDKNNQRLSTLFTLSKQQWLLLTIFFLVASLFFILLHPFPVMFTALGILTCWAAYSLPHYGLKGIPFGGIFVSFFTEVLLFHLSFLFFAPYSISSICVATYFGLLVAAGHALHELIDYKADEEVNIRTTAVFLGLEKARRVPFYIFLLAFMLLISCNVLQFLSFYPFLLLTAANIATLFLTYRLFNSVDRLHFVRVMYLSSYVVALLLLSLTL